MRVEDEKARKFYAEESVKSKWIVRQLEKQIMQYCSINPEDINDETIEIYIEKLKKYYIKRS